MDYHAITTYNNLCQMYLHPSSLRQVLNFRLIQIDGSCRLQVTWQKSGLKKIEGVSVALL